VLYYTAVCEGQFGKSRPFTLFVQNTSGDALAWNQAEQRWQYDPVRAEDFTSNDQNWDRFSAVDRAAAAEFAIQLAIAPGVDSTLPSEEWIVSFFTGTSHLGGTL
jgi:hypothetical protein